MKLFRHILLSAALPLAAIVLSFVFAPSGPPAASAAGDAPAAEVCHAAPGAMQQATGWLEALLGSTRDLLS